MPGANGKESPEIGERLKDFFERHKILNKLKDLVKKGLGLAKDTAVTAGTAAIGAGIRIAGGQKAFNNWMERRDAEADREEIKRANQKMIGSKVACPDGGVYIEGTIKKISQSKGETECEIELVSGKTMTVNADNIMTLEEFRLKNNSRPQDLKMTLIDEAAWKKHQETEEAKNSEPVANKNDAPEKEQPTVPSEAQFEAGQKLYSAISYGEGTDKAYAGFLELTISDAKSKEGKTFYEISYPNGKTRNVSEKQLVNTLKNDDVFTKEDFENKFGKTSMLVYTVEHPKGTPAKDMFTLPNNDTQELPENDKDTKEEKESNDMPRDEDSPSDKDENEQFSADTQQEEAPQKSEEDKIEKEDVPQKTEADEIDSSETETQTAETVKMFDFPEDDVVELTEEETAAQKAIEQEASERFEEEIRQMTEASQVEDPEVYEPSYAESGIDRGSESPVKQKEPEAQRDASPQAATFDIPKNIDTGSDDRSLRVSDHVLYAFKGKYQEAEITAINKKGIELKLNNGRKCSVKKTDVKNTLFGYEDIKKDKVMNQCVKDENNLKFSDEFRQAYLGKTEQIQFVDHQKESEVDNKETSSELDDLGDLFENDSAVEVKSFKELAAEATKASRDDLTPQNSYQSQSRDNNELGLDI